MTAVGKDWTEVGKEWNVELTPKVEFQYLDEVVVMTEVEFPEMTTGQMVVPTGTTEVMVVVEFAGQCKIPGAQAVTVCLRVEKSVCVVIVVYALVVSCFDGDDLIIFEVRVDVLTTGLTIVEVDADEVMTGIREVKSAVPFTQLGPKEQLVTV
jgi:hypothetical protein